MLGGPAGTDDAAEGPDRDQLAVLASELTSLIRDDTWRPENAQRLGSALARAQRHRPQGLGALPRLVRLHADTLLGEPTPPGLLDQLLGAVATGYARELHEHSLMEHRLRLREARRTHRKVQRALRANEMRFRTVFTELGVGIALIGLDGTVMDVNPTLRGLLGLNPAPPEERGPEGRIPRQRANRRPRPLTEHVHPADVDTVREDFTRLTLGQHTRLPAEIRFYRTDGTLVWTHVTATLVRDVEGRPDYVIAVIEDITERHHLRTRLRHQAYHDQLTRLPNRALLDAQLRWAFSEHSDVRRVGVCHLDLDGFRTINDSLGHEAGDQLLLAVAGRLQALAGQHLVARIGGDEFAILVTDPPGVDYLCGLAKDVLAGLRPPLRIGGRQLELTASMGIAEDDVGDTWPGELQRAAESARSWAKTAGGGRWLVFDPHRDAGETSQFALAASVSGAVDRHEFHLLYQPLVALADGALTGVEALVRWRHPEHGLLGPAQFIDLAERNGAIVPLGRWVLTEACRQARRWADQFGRAAPYVSVNVAPRQLAEPGWLGEVSDVLAETGLRPEQLQLEITERAVLVDEASATDTLHALRDMGVRLTIDDFGTGYSSLSYLRRLPVHGLKIDGEFIRGLTCEDHTESRDGKIVEALIGMAHALGLQVTAEWVETAAQARWLAALGCDIGQGNWYGPPITPFELDELLRRPLAG